MNDINLYKYLHCNFRILVLHMDYQSGHNLYKDLVPRHSSISFLCGSGRPSNSTLYKALSKYSKPTNLYNQDMTTNFFNNLKYEMVKSHLSGTFYELNVRIKFIQLKSAFWASQSLWTLSHSVSPVSSHVKHLVYQKVFIRIIYNFNLKKYKFITFSWFCDRKNRKLLYMS